MELLYRRIVPRLQKYLKDTSYALLYRTVVVDIPVLIEVFFPIMDTVFISVALIWIVDIFINT